MTLDGSTIFAEDSLEHVAMRSARKLVDKKGSASRKHFLDAYAEHLDALKRNRSAK